MPLELLLIMVIGGVGGIALLLHLLGLSRQRALIDSEAIRAEWRRHFPEDEVKSTHAATDAHAALVETPGGPGLLWVMGADCTARHLTDVGIEDDPSGLTFRFSDIGAPRVKVALDDDQRSTWRAILKRADAA